MSQGNFRLYTDLRHPFEAIGVETSKLKSNRISALQERSSEGYFNILGKNTLPKEIIHSNNFLLSATT